VWAARRTCLLIATAKARITGLVPALPNLREPRTGTYTGWQQLRCCWIGGQLTVPNEQNTQQ